MSRASSSLGFAAILAWGFLSAGCSQSSAVDGTQQPTVSAVDVNPMSPLEVGFINDVIHAPHRVRHGGTRRITYNYESNGSVYTLIYNERVVTDGQGHFAIDPGVVEVPDLTTPQREIFELLQKEREGFFHRFRDFSIRAAGLFQTNYTVEMLAATPTIAGRVCTEIEVRRVDHARSWYLVDVDAETGLVMRYSEFGVSGELLAKCEFTTFTLTPDTQGVQFFSPQYPGVPLDTTQHTEANLGFQPATPRYLPAGYQHQSSEVVDQGGRKWVRRTFGDGLENLFVLHGGPQNAGQATTANPRIATHPDQVSAVTAVPESFTVRVCQFGPWTLAEVARGSENIFAIGKIGEAEIARVLQSAL